MNPTPILDKTDEMSQTLIQKNPFGVQKSVQDCKEVNTYNPNIFLMTIQECATKRIPVCPSTWEAVHELRRPGQTFDDVIRELVKEENRRRLFDETRRIMEEDDFVLLSEIKA